MPRAVARTVALIVVLFASSGGTSLAAPLFTLAEDGRTFLYRARPGDHPGVVAEMFGIRVSELDAFLRANRIADATRIEPGFVYRIPNPFAARTERLEADNGRLFRAAAEAGERARTLEREAAEARASAAVAERQAARLAGFEPRWSVAKVVLVIMAVALAAMGAVTVAAVRRQQQAERYARALAAQLEEKQRMAIADRQESARRTLDLENRIRTLEAQLGPRVVVGGRST